MVVEKKAKKKKTVVCIIELPPPVRQQRILIDVYWPATAISDSDACRMWNRQQQQQQLRWRRRKTSSNRATGKDLVWNDVASVQRIAMFDQILLHVVPLLCFVWKKNEGNVQDLLSNLHKERAKKRKENNIYLSLSSLTWNGRDIFFSFIFDWMILRNSNCNYLIKCFFLNRILR